ncbi:MAG: hypothetical protein JOS17DRAFT_778113 [Linnemannia elongata]|nr:MAG: hypothetical protein JOS17DRAFT_778113 [Linnemannia elongata]
MSKESHSTSSGSPAPSTHSTQSTATFRSRASSLFSINSTFGRKAKGAAEPPSTTKSRSINQGIAAILVEGSLPPAHHIHGDTGDDDDNKSLSSRRVRKRDKFLGRFWSPIPEPKIRQSQTPSPKASVNHRISPASTQFNDDSENEVSSTEVTPREIYAQSSAPPTKPHSDDFLQNVDKPAVFISLPRLGDRTETTPDLALRFGLLPIVSEAMEQQEHPMQAFSCDTAAQHLWVKAMKQDPSEQDPWDSYGG